MGAFLLDEGGEVGDRIDAGIGRHDHDKGRFREADDGHDVLLDVDWHFAEQSGIAGRADGGGEQQRQAIGLGVPGGIERQIARRADPVLDEERAPRKLAKFLRIPARHDVGTAAGREAEHNAYRPIRISGCCRCSLGEEDSGGEAGSCLWCVWPSGAAMTEE